MVLVSTIVRIGQVAARAITRYNRYESKLFDSAYRGFPRSVGRGARHGYIGGTIAGTLLGNDAPDTPGNELQKPFQKSPKYASQTYQQNKTRRRQTGRCNPRYRRQYYSRSSRR